MQLLTEIFWGLFHFGISIVTVLSTAFHKRTYVSQDGTPREGPRPTTIGTAGRHHRVETERFKSFAYDELVKRDKVSLHIFWLKDDALEESANLPSPVIIAQEIADDLEAALEQFATIAEDLK